MKMGIMLFHMNMVLRSQNETIQNTRCYNIRDNTIHLRRDNDYPGGAVELGK